MRGMEVLEWVQWVLKVPGGGGSVDAVMLVSGGQ